MLIQVQRLILRWLGGDMSSIVVEHLKLQVAKGADYFGDLDLTPFTDAIAKGL